ncbi:MAG: L,D-transpeptidase family protein [Patescibacteria group bacterium]|jgi:lipoprotein-anchoring transpeptidase ErfK/SrfK
MKKYIIIALVSLFAPMAVFAVDSMEPQVKIFNDQLKETKSFLALDGKNDNGLDVSVADVDGDNKAEIIIGAGRGSAPLVQVFKADGTKISEFYAYDKSLLSGVHVAAGDFNRDHKAEIVTTPDYGGGPQVKIFDQAGNQKFTPGFFAFDEGFRGGADITVGDFNGDRSMDIAVAAGPGGEPHVRIFNKKGEFLGTEFRPFAADNKGGVVLATANVDGGRDRELVMAIHSGGEDWVKVYKNNGQILGEWKAFNGLYTGLNVGAGDIDDNGLDEVVVTPRQDAGAQLMFYKGHGKYLKNFFAYNEDFRGGVNVASGDLNGDGKDDWVTVPGKNRAQGRSDLVRYIDVNLTQQTTRVYEYGELVHEFLISSGIPKYPSPVGNFSVLQKSYIKDYVHSYGTNHPDNYALYNVKWNMRFNGPYFLHYAYWHNNFGHRMSHGCININAANAEWLYNWSKVGDPVIVHY